SCAYRMKQNYQSKRDTNERIQKVCSMWALIVEMLTSLEKDKAVVGSVLEDCVHQCVLDGTNIFLSAPGLLAQRLERNKQELLMGNLYEGGKLNFLAVIQLLNEALRVLRDEHCQSELKELHRITDIVTSCHKALQRLNTKRLEREQHFAAICESISRKHEDWETKWETFIGQCPSDLILKEVLVSTVHFI
ncbi:HAUS6 protein, partial [Pitta sordida]|nr:HAUS6 protein [Pitta sordida]